MVEIEIDGKKVEVPEGSMVMHAANKLGVNVPHFCYHKKLSIAANCRMCLVEVEKAPKPLPACATPVSDGMKVFTRSERAVSAQKSVMEFLLINHPLDCPICDQGGECQLQDLAVGYGGSSSSYSEGKRVVFHKSIGPLVSAQEMARCIHCTRCVRFGQEVAGVMELGMASRGEHAEIMTFVGRSVDSELSGNMIDLCPVGALTSKPFRYSARTWELSRRKTIAPHDSLGSNIVAQIKGQEVMRVVPLENDAVNECWISDRDRFSYEGLNADDRLTTPMVKQNGEWVETDWQTALNQAALLLATARMDHGSAKVAGLAAPTSTFEELFLLQKMVRAMGSDNVDFRLRQSNFDIDTAGQGAPWLGMNIERISSLDRLLLLGSFVRHDHPLIAARLRQAGKQGLSLSLVHASDDDLLMPVANKAILPASQWRDFLLQVLAAVLEAKGLALPEDLSASLTAMRVSEEARAMATDLIGGESAAVLFGNAAMHHPQAGDLMRIGSAIAQAGGLTFGVIGESANSVGGYLAGATPRAVGAVNVDALGTDGLNVAEQLTADMRAWLLLNLEPQFDFASGAAAVKAMAMADTVVAMTAYKSGELLEVAHVLLPVTPFTETGGSFVNAEGRLQSFNGVVRAAGDSRPAWKVMRVLGNLMDFNGFDFDSVEDVRVSALIGQCDDGRARFAASASRVDEIAGPQSRFSVFEDALSNKVDGELQNAAIETAREGELERIANVPIYAGDALLRRADSLQRTAIAKAPIAWAHPDSMAKHQINDGDMVHISQGSAETLLPLHADSNLVPGAIRLAAANSLTADLPSLFGPVTLRRA